MMMTRTPLLFLVFVAFSAVANAFVSPFGVCKVHRGAPLAVKIKVEVGDGEPIESALRRFKREINKSGHLIELRHKRYFENSQEKKKRKVKEARMRKKFERMQKRRMAERT